MSSVKDLVVKNAWLQVNLISAGSTTWKGCDRLIRLKDVEFLEIVGQAGPANTSGKDEWFLQLAVRNERYRVFWDYAEAPIKEQALVLIDLIQAADKA